MKAWFEVKCCYGDCTDTAKIGGNDGKAGWELIGWFIKRWYCPEHGLIMLESKRAALAYNSPPLGIMPVTGEQTLDELMAML